MPKWTIAQKARVKKTLAKFTVNDPMIVSEEMLADLKENGMLYAERTLVQTSGGLVVTIPWADGILWRGKGNGDKNYYGT